MERLDKSCRNCAVGCNWLNQPHCIYHRALIGYPMRFALRHLLKTTLLIVVEDQEGSANVEAQKTNGKAEMSIVDEH